MDNYNPDHWDVIDSEQEDLNLFFDTHPYIPRDVIMPADLFDRSEYELEKKASQYQNAQHLKSLGLLPDQDDLAHRPGGTTKQKRSHRRCLCKEKFLSNVTHGRGDGKPILKRRRPISL